MFTYRCPSCGKQHVADKEPAEGFTATCLRCRGAIQVPGPALAAASAPPSQRPASKEPPPAEDTAAGAPEPEVTGAAKADPRKQAITRQPGQGKNGKPATKKVKKVVKEPEPEAETEAADAAASTPPPEEPKKEPTPGPKFVAKPPPKEGIDPKHKLIAAAVAAVLVLGVGGYFLFSGKKSPKPTKTAGKKTSPKKTPLKTPAKKDKDKPDPKLKAPVRTEPVFKATNARVYHLSAARLSAELAASPADADAKYFGATLEVTGIFARMEQKESIKSGARPHALFKVAGSPVYADPLGGPTPEKDWKTLAGKVITVRGAYSRNGFLHGCELLKGDPKATPPWEPSSPDARYRGKEIELSGFVARPQAGGGGGGNGGFPTLSFERETNGTLDVVCYFAKSEAEWVKMVKVGDPVVVRGTCNGRKGKTIRLDNCKLSNTTAPEGMTPRVEVVAFLRAYEEDLFPFLRPPPGEEESVDKELTPRGLLKTLTENPKALELYLGKRLTVAGSVVARNTGSFTVTLGFEDTVKSFNVLCAFRRQQFEDIDESASFRIRGLCTALLDKKTLRLDNCEVDKPATGDDKRRLTAAYLPHVPGQNVTYDVSTFPELNETALFRRVVCLQRDNGVTTTLQTHRALATSHSLFEPGIEKWVNWRKARLLKSLPGPIFVHRVNGRYVEVGEVVRLGAMPTSWEPVLKIGTRLGDSWKWTDRNVSHKYTVYKFGEHKGRPSVTLLEVISAPGMVYPKEVTHFYVEGVGEVKRQEVLRINPTATRILSEKKLIEDDSAKPAKPPLKATK